MRIKHFLLYHIIILLSIVSLLIPRTGFLTEEKFNFNGEFEKYSREIDKLKEKIEAKETKIKELEERAASYKETIEEKRGEANTLVNEVLVLDSQRRKLDTEIEITQTKIGETEASIEKLTLELKTKESEIKMLKKRTGIILRTIREYDEIDLAEILLRGDNFSKIFNIAEAVKILQEEIQEKVEALKIVKLKLESERLELNFQKEELENLEEELYYKKVIVEGEKKKKKDLLNVTKGQERKFQNLLKDVEAKQKEIQKEIAEIESRLRHLIDPSKIPPPQKGLFSWPCEGVITQGYGLTSKTGFINPVYDFHNGIDIASSIGTPIKAPLGGKVAASGTNGHYAYGSWLAIDHQNGLITLYAHLSAKKVKVEEEVKRGQIIGYMGSTGFSTGSHLHFTVYAANTFETKDKWFGLLPLGGSLNPMNYL
ncbi:MAG: hypothetical protein COV69_01760 [Parcubacteria group bacterium CG11_big_fil_rev_8_21_14_0_20_39_14]|nr:MAG: hypothetical protein COV69_01760 [Parcubacteria group bacterium CG11_big_fil_rev_8_21_14_0_20_39_14]